MKHQAQCCRRFLHFAEVGVVGGEGLKIQTTPKRESTRHHLGENLKPLADKTRTLVRLPGDIAARTGEACDQPETDRVRGEGEDDRNCRRELCLQRRPRVILMSQ